MRFDSHCSGHGMYDDDIICPCGTRMTSYNEDLITLWNRRASIDYSQTLPVNIIKSTPTMSSENIPLGKFNSLEEAFQALGVKRE